MAEMIFGETTAELWEHDRWELVEPVIASTDDGETRVTIPSGTVLHVRRRVTQWPEITRANERKKLLALADALFDDLFEAADGEILEELREAGHTPEALRQERRKNLEEAEKAAASPREDEG
jgi:hypothetical protein